MNVGEFLVTQGKITKETWSAVDQALPAGADDTEWASALIAGGHCDETTILQARAEWHGYALWTAIPDDVLAPDLVTKLPVDWARQHCLLPIRSDGHPAAVTDDPGRDRAIDDLELLLGEELKLVLAPRQIVLQAIDRCYLNRESGTGALLATLPAGKQDASEQTGTASTNDLLRMADNAPVAQLVNWILLDAMKSNASDIHIEPYQNHLRLRFRVDGILYERPPPPKQLEAALVSRLKVMAHLDIAEKRMPQDGAARVRVGEREVDIRTSTAPVTDGERLVLRILNRASTLLPLAALGLPNPLLERLRTLCHEPFGVIWVTGPTGSGKTTTLYAALQEVNTRELNVITIEDPVEYQLPTISQMGVNPKIGLTFARGLRNILRQDPDVILVGETRDLETAEIVVRSSLTGHLVFSTLHTNDAAGVAVRLQDMGIAHYLVAASLRGALAQRLVRRLCPHCRRAAAPTPTQRELLGPLAKRLDHVTGYVPGECDACTGGYKGRLGLFEILEVDGEIQDLIRTGGGLHTLRQTARARGMRTLLDDGLDKVAAGETSLEEVLRVVGHHTHEHV